MKLKSIALALAGGLAIASSLHTRAADLVPARLRCEYQVNPSQVDVAAPRLSWYDAPAKKNKCGLSQTRYEVRVGTDAKQLAKGQNTLWFTTGIEATTFSVTYNGPKLQSGTTYYWQVRVKDQNGKFSKWSQPQSWTMGMLQPSDWKCKWIGAPWDVEEATKYSGKSYPAPLLRKAFSINKPIKSAKFFGTGLGYFELYVNGQKVGNDVLAPNQTNYGKRPGLANAGIIVSDNFKEYRTLYVGHDVTSLLKQGDNAVGAILGNGFYNALVHWDEPYGSPRFFGQIIITYADGTTSVVASDETWKAQKSAIVSDGIFQGEAYDATQEHTGWATTSYDDADWQPAALRKAPFGHLVAQNGPADKVVETFKPTKIEKLGDGHYKVSFPVEISGWAHLYKINAAKGNKIDIKYISESPLGSNSYVAKGTGNEDYAARFTWFVFSQLEVQGWQGEFTEQNITAEAVNSAVETTGHFQCSNELFNKINDCYVRSQLDNMHGSIASDCPHRERTAYTGDGQVACPAAMANLDVEAFYNKWIADIRGAQNPVTGFVPNAAPWQPGAGGGVPWGAAMNIMPWEFYMSYGDKQMLATNYAAMKAQLAYMGMWVEPGDYIMQKKDPQYWQTLGEWVPPYELVNSALVHTWYYWRCADITARVAKILGHNDEAAKYATLATNIKDAFNRKFYDSSAKSYGAYGGNIFALNIGVPQDRLQGVLASLRADIEKNGGHLDTGIYGTSMFFTTLARYGMSDLAYNAMNKDDYPSFGNWIKQGATTTWEQWNGANSRNHPMFGGGLVWFYRDLAGMSYDENNPGYRNIIFHPIIPSQLNSASYSNITPQGEAGISWKRNGNNIDFTVTIPVGSTASISLPGETVVKLSDDKHLSIFPAGNDRINLSAAQGTYHITVAQ